MEFDNITLKEAVKLYIHDASKAIQIYGPIEDWKTGNVTDMSCLFSSILNFNQDISKWDVSNVNDMKHMFSGARNFNQDISEWNVSNVTNMYGMFSCASEFNQDISKWDVSNVTDMYRMFFNASNFNQDISEWNVGNVTNMRNMFLDACNFNQDISEWNVANVRNMHGMFYYASNFNQDISKWKKRFNVKKNDIIANTLLETRLLEYNTNDCFDEKIMSILFSYERRKDFMNFLVGCSFMTFKGKYIGENIESHKVFDIEDMNRNIMSYL